MSAATNQDDGELVRQIHSGSSAAAATIRTANQQIGEIFIRRRAQDGEAAFQDWLATLGLPLSPADVALYLQWGANSPEEMMARVHAERQRVVSEGRIVLAGEPGTMEATANRINEWLAKGRQSHLDQKRFVIAAGHALLAMKRQIGEGPRFDSWVKEFVTDTPAMAEAAMTFATYNVPDAMTEMDVVLMENRVESALWKSSVKEAMEGELSALVLHRFAALVDTHRAGVYEGIAASQKHLQQAGTIVRHVHQNLGANEFEKWSACLSISRDEVEDMIQPDSPLGDIMEGSGQKEDGQP